MTRKIEGRRPRARHIRVCMNTMKTADIDTFLRVTRIQEGKKGKRWREILEAAKAFHWLYKL